LALLAPAFVVHPSQIPKFPDPRELLNGVPLNTDDRLKASTREEGFIKARKEDRLALPKVKTSYLMAILGLQREWPRAAADLKLPLFIGVAGKDRVVEPKVVKKVYDLAGTPKKDKTWREWDEAYHTLCWDPLTPKVVEEMAKWALALSKSVMPKTKK
jgi:alpha-beta hydrolase superfamily lysophospholipase